MPQNGSETKTGMGLVTDVRDATSKKNRKYFWVTIGDNEFSCWKLNLKKHFKVGASVQFQYTEDEESEYRNIVSVESDTDESPEEPKRASGMTMKDEIEVRKSLLIAKESCLKSSVELVSANLSGVSDDIIERAKQTKRVYWMFLPLLLPNEKVEPPEPEE